jgi:hypothetical protein
MSVGCTRIGVELNYYTDNLITGYKNKMPQQLRGRRYILGDIKQIKKS